MKYGFLPKLMWTAFKKSFKKELADTLGEKAPENVMKKAHAKYKDIIAGVDEFDKNDRFIINILSCAMLSAILLNVRGSYTTEEIRAYYRNSMNGSKAMQMAGKKKNSYTEKAREKLRRQAKWSETNDNPYSWKFSVEDGATINQYTATFYTCGACRLMKELGLEKYVPAMCAYDYDMAAMSNTVFTREYTLASGGPYCDCHYDHKE